MKRTSLIAVSTLLWTAQLQAQAAPAAPAPKPAAAVAKPAAPAAPTSAAAPVAKPAPTAAATPAANADKNVEWQLDAAHSNVGFTARHIVSKATGQFKKFSAVIKADPKTAKLSSLEATVETASIDTGIEKRDAHLKGDDFFNSEKYPQLKLSAKSFKWNGNKFTATTDLTIRDVTKPVTFKGELIGVHAANFGQGAHQRAGYEATATVNRKDFGLKWAMVTEGLAVVGDNVDININVELMYTPPAATTAAAPAAPTAAPAATTAAATPTKPATAPAAPAATPTPKQPTAAAPHTAAKPAAAPAKPAQQAAAQPQAH